MKISKAFQTWLRFSSKVYKPPFSNRDVVAVNDIISVVPLRSLKNR